MVFNEIFLSGFLLAVRAKRCNSLHINWGGGGCIIWRTWGLGKSRSVQLTTLEMNQFADGLWKVIEES